MIYVEKFFRLHRSKYLNTTHIDIIISYLWSFVEIDILQPLSSNPKPDPSHTQFVFEQRFPRCHENSIYFICFWVFVAGPNKKKRWLMLFKSISTLYKL